MRCFSRVSRRGAARGFGAVGDRFAPTSSTNWTAYTDPWQARKASVPSLPARYRQGARKAGHGRGKAGARQGRGRGHGSYVLSLITRRE